ncbi:MAG: response regulator transcription factor [Ignavibacteria bacterium]|nr:response regulator transcription factor [Ignavibacteria bacterium]
MEIKSFIIDDELHARKNIRFLLKNFIPEVSIVGEYCNVKKAIKAIPEKRPDLVFLDIQMPDLTGFDFLEIAGERNFEVIFVTAHNKFGVEAVKAGALDYILKPISVSELRTAIDKFKKIGLQKTKSNDGKDKDFNIKIPQSHGFAFIDSREITRLEAENNYTRVFTIKGEQFFTCKTIKEFEILLDSKLFLRIHKSSIINLNCFKEFVNMDGAYVLLKDDSKIAVSRRKIHDLKDAINKFTTTYK